MGYVTTYTGKSVDPLNAKPEDFDVRDIAHSLSMTCRGNGHVKQFLSVGQHCVWCAREAAARGYSKRVILACLLHDASEAYMSDVPRPLKEILPDYVAAEERLLELVYSRYLGAPLSEEEQALVKAVDDDLLYFDLREQLGIQQESPEPRLGIKIDYAFRPFTEVEQEYIALYEKYMGI